MNDGRWTIWACCLLVFSDSMVIASEQGNFANPRPDRGQSAPAPQQLNPAASRKIEIPAEGGRVPQSENDKKCKNELQRLIAQIRSIKLEPKNQEPKPVIAIEPVSITEPNETLSTTEASQSATGGQEKQTQLQPDSHVPYKPVSSQTLQMLENISKSAEGRNLPRTNWPVDKGPTRTSDAREFSVQLVWGKAFELAEILFLSGHLKQAAMFYQQALNCKDPNDITSAQDRAWILFQIGNCLTSTSSSQLRDDDLLTAKKMYRQLIAEYPNFPWIDLAKARDNLIDWYLNDKPLTLLKENVE